MHTPVLLKEVIEQLNVQPNGKYIDATYGEGGHSRAIAAKGGTVLSIEWDAEKVLEVKKLPNENNEIVNANFADIRQIAIQHGFEKVDGILFDLGLSMRQIAVGERGFSFKKWNEPLDMRINSTLTETAADILNDRSEEQLMDIFSRNSEEPSSALIAHMIVLRRHKEKFIKVSDLVEIIGEASGFNKESIVKRIFQALRIEVNHEFENLRKGLEGAVELIKDEGKILVITFHSLEDRIVKRYVQESKTLYFVTKKPITAENAARFEKTAQLRIIGKKI